MYVCTYYIYRRLVPTTGALLSLLKLGRYVWECSLPNVYAARIVSLKWRAACGAPQGGRWRACGTRRWWCSGGSTTTAAAASPAHPSWVQLHPPTTSGSEPLFPSHSALQSLTNIIQNQKQLSNTHIWQTIFDKKNLWNAPQLLCSVRTRTRLL